MYATSKPQSTAETRRAPARRPPARRFVYGFLASVIAGLVALGGFNYVVNPLNYYPPRIVKPLSWGDQLVKLDLMKRAPAPQVLILGSSRTMKLAPADVASLTGKTAFNGGVSSSRPEEWYSMLRYSLDDLNWPVKEIVLGIDMETLFYSGEPNEDLLSSGELRRYLPSSLRVSSLWERSKLLVSWDQFKLSRKALQKAAEPPAPAELTFDPDGYLHYVGWEKAVSGGTFTLVTRYQVSNYEQRYAGAEAMNPMRKELFEQLLQLAQERGIRVRAFFTPFHPSVLAEMTKLPTYRYVRTESLRYATELTVRYPNLTVADFTDVSRFGGDPDNFFDGVHYRQENAEALLTQLYRK